MKRTTIAAAVSGIALGSIVGVYAAGLPRATGGAVVRGRKRSGFTMVELLVVISIIAVLAALSLRVIVGFLTIGKEAATKTTLQKIHRVVMSRHEEWLRKWGGNDPSTIARIHNSHEWNETLGFSTTANQPLTDGQRLILARKLKYIRANPQTSADLTGYPWNIPATAVAGIDNSEILYHIATGLPLVDSAGATIPATRDNRTGIVGLSIEFNAQESGDPDGDGNRSFIDAWGHPIVAFRWLAGIYRADIDGSGGPADPPHETYTGSILPHVPRPTDSNGQPMLSLYGTHRDDLARDPLDPLRLMATVQGFAQTFHTPATATFSAVMSAGPDGELGLTDAGELSTPWQSLSQNQAENIRLNIENRRLPLDDNISAAKIRAGGN